MIKVFRSFRRRLIRESRFTRYLLYAIGEIFLVVIGILIALRINNWNEERKIEDQLNTYLLKVQKELKMNISSLDFQAKMTDSLIRQLKESLYILNNNEKDSLVKLESTIGALGTDYNIQVQLPNTIRLLERGELINKSHDTLAFYLIGTRYFLNAIEESNKYTHDQYANSIEPYFHQHINYADVALPEHRGFLVSGGPETNYSVLNDDLYLWNLLTFKLETVSIQKELIMKVIELFEKFQDYLNNRPDV
ncbi:hypothetical protein GCM10023115_28460 [Pontixanthobacter gangjinensis]|uniref:Uncharacterized protein n=1 Tax=Christiangramia aestuarii TaxID=1028746 RepID=A0A7K1LMW8_9FLAO|nr:DUF6090 family protein [Christiangramia aestuarii]MUP42078.1 hypothetical protein [Christiangramia aestuarii]